jgi:acylphosphatase
MADGVVRAHVTVSGRVQGVWFRQSTVREAAAKGLAGWVRNLDSGHEVEAVFEGPRPQVDEMLAWIAHGPELATVEHVETAWEDPAGETGFGLR